MGKIIEIIKKNNTTFYRFDTKRPIKIWPRIALFVLFSLFFVSFSKDINTSVLGALLTVQSVLIGFSFSVLFFLLSFSPLKIDINGSIEKTAKKEKVEVLSVELFYNISYYNGVAIFSVILILLLITPNLDYQELGKFISSLGIIDTGNVNLGIDVVERYLDYAKMLTEMLLYFLIAESIYTFSRILGRATYLFSKKQELEKA